MTTQLTEAGQKLADALVAAKVMDEQYLDAGDLIGLNTAAQILLTPEGGGMQATEITLGVGLVDITEIKHEGRVGILFRPRQEHVPFGGPGVLPEGEYWPVAGDVVLWVAGDGPGVAIDALAALAPKTSAPGNDAGMREALAADVLHYIQSSENGLSRVPRQLLCRVEDVLRTGASLSPPTGSAGDDETGVREADRGRQTADVGVFGPIDGMGNLDRSGPYIGLSIASKSSAYGFRISMGAAEVLLAELSGLLAALAPQPPKAEPPEGNGPDVANHYRLRAERAEQFANDMRKARNYSDSRRDYWINEAQRLAWVVRGLGVDPDAAPQPPKAETPAIPAGIYYNDGNFYDMASRMGLGNEFYATWRQRHSEFPTSPKAKTPEGAGRQPEGVAAYAMRETAGVRDAARKIAAALAPAARAGDGVERVRAAFTEWFTSTGLGQEHRGITANAFHSGFHAALTAAPAANGEDA